MKQVIIFILVLLLVIFAGVCEISYLNESSKYFMSDIRDIYQSAMRNDYETGTNEIDSLKDTWKELRKTWALVINDGEMDSIEDDLTAFTSYIKTNNREETTKEYNLLISKINHVVGFQEIKVENIF